ncbi:hypothetical protein FCL43_007755 [Enterobacter hormaechei]|jgi:hypothetical protein|uniref:hypothetical protein n=1 Tax=Enterobacteriaceae TaxID=543 RepID=UPI00079A4C29|nr:MULTISPECIES: hypothetical protein [Enterobacteriaceae]EMD6795861.1 hypothetical protein [Enterobacter hormaechei subsp. steigerwaltii]MCC2945908.1 hypothetical protein [Citrobacter freundii]HAW1708376.1 hypothetical protein [Escherichia coli]EJR0237628.1 hypothetical protein [Enterobacter hormaechei]EKJ6981545.1 hypothetical protein [Enterobacter hormaechei]
MRNNPSKHDIHFFDKYIKWLSSKPIMISAWLLTMAAGVVASYCLKQWSILPRFGCMGIMIGTLLTLSPLFAQGVYLSRSEAAIAFGHEDEDGNLVVTSPKGRAVSRNILYGVLMIVISSIINAFGDLLGYYYA